MIKKYIVSPFLIPAYILAIVFLGYSIYHTLILHPEPVQEPTLKKPERKVVDNTKPITNKSTVDPDKSITETVKGRKSVEKPVRIENTQQREEPDWTTKKPVVKIHKSDPFKDHSKTEQAKNDGSWIGDPEKMDREDLHKAIRQQMINRFGDTPEVHAMMDFQDKKMRGIQMTLNEQIEGQKATASIFPSETNRKTLAFYEWMRTKGTKYKTEFSAEDIKELRSIGINVNTELDDGGGIKVSFTTK